jgi:hypothetical protein
MAGRRLSSTVRNIGRATPKSFSPWRRRTTHPADALECPTRRISDHSARPGLTESHSCRIGP